MRFCSCSVHGYSHDWLDWLQFRQDVFAGGFDAVVAVDIGPASAPVDVEDMFLDVVVGAAAYWSAVDAGIGAEVEGSVVDRG